MNGTQVTVEMREGIIKLLRTTLKTYRQVGEVHGVSKTVVERIAREVLSEAEARVRKHNVMSAAFKGRKGNDHVKHSTPLIDRCDTRVQRVLSVPWAGVPVTFEEEEAFHELDARLNPR